MAACRTPSCWNCSPTAAPVPASTAAATANKKIAQSPAESYNKGNEPAPLLRGGWHNADAFILAGSPSPSLLRKSTSPKGRGLGKEMKFAWTAKGSHFGGAGIAQR
ncbi:hypothetical protein C4N24_10600 [Faecalibacterium prausnitzii]|uniref:Uncharacterized protein n=1 Tax=Faecalibacterium prausnitzii TaxID=853 RepID=A0A329U645_9FIRM|nr:hypothetical protein C4N24_10600 [Faecalibacterium prausnitzii]